MRLFSFWLIFSALQLSCVVHAATYQSHQLQDNKLQLQTDEYRVSLSFKSKGSVEVLYQKTGMKQLPSFALALPDQQLAASLTEQRGSLEFATSDLKVRINKAPFQLSYYRGDELILAEEHGFFAHETLRGFRFKLQQDEKLLGTGQRVVGMDRRGQRLPLYNKASYGYTTEAQQMYFGLPAVLSSKKYLLLFDNSASGFVDLGKTEKDVLQFEAVAGRASYIVMAAATYPGLIEQYVTVTGKQPL
ncbi:MAG: DUF4968 domain-containing protein, partial [Pararheinheimera sp.]